MKYFVIFDKKSGAYNPQMFAATSIPEAVRSIQMAISDGKGQLANFPADFQLYYVGDFDTISGTLTPATEKGPLMLQEVAQIQSEYLLGKVPPNKGGDK